LFLFSWRVLQCRGDWIRTSDLLNPIQTQAQHAAIFQLWPVRRKLFPFLFLGYVTEQKYIMLLLSTKRRLRPLMRAHWRTRAASKVALMTPTLSERLLTIQEVAKLYNVAVRTLRRWITEGRIPQPMHINQRVLRWKASEIQRHLENLPN
jgi:excisionase family DNA binding protein